MATLFGNYDPLTKTSFRKVPANSKFEANFPEGVEMTMKAFFFRAASDAGTEKQFLVTYGVPKGKSEERAYDCHACAPLIGAALFSRKAGEWVAESFNPAVMVYGQFGHPPDAQFVAIGPRRMGVELTLNYGGQGEYTTTAAILVPWRGDFTEAFWTTMADRYEDCKFSKLPCYKYTKKMHFIAGTNPEYFDISLESSGTNITGTEPPQRIRVSGIETLQFASGKYERTQGARPTHD